MTCGALVMRFIEPLGFFIGSIGITVAGLVSFLFLRAAGRTSKWRSSPRWKDLPIVAAKRLDAGTKWVWLGILDVIVILTFFILVWAQP
jgi:hypothetical protein